MTNLFVMTFLLEQLTFQPFHVLAFSTAEKR